MVSTMAYRRRFRIIMQFYLELLHIMQNMFSDTPDNNAKFKFMIKLCMVETHKKIEINPTVISNHWTPIRIGSSARYHALGLSPSPTCTEHTTKNKCAQNMALHTTELALHTTVPVFLDNQTCL